MPTSLSGESDISTMSTTTSSAKSVRPVKSFQSVNSVKSAHSHKSGSTHEWDHTPFDEFSIQVRQLCLDLWPHNTAPGSIHVGRLRGGAYNRVVSILIDNVNPDSEERRPGRYVLRVARRHTSGENEHVVEQRLQRQIATLRFVKQRCPKLPIPSIIKFDLTCKNAISNAYVIQERMPGVVLQDHYPFFSQRLRKAVVKEMARVIKELSSVTSADYGCVHLARQLLDKDENISNDDFSIAHPTITSMGTPHPDDLFNWTLNNFSKDRAGQQQTVLEFILFQYWRLQVISSIEEDEVQKGYLNRFTAIAREMKKFGSLGPDDIVFLHNDLAPRNILVEYDEYDMSDRPVKITAVLDWDDAMFAPRVMSCEPPSWVWQWKDNENEDESRAPETPGDPQLRELKELFEDEMGPDYIKLSYNREHRLARKVCKLSFAQLCYNEQLKAADLLFHEWNDVKRVLESKARWSPKN